jgi:large subunit ribosomal protein L24
MGQRIRTGDTVEIITGKDRGKRGKVLETRPDQGRVLIEGRNLVKRHARPRPVPGTRGAQMTPGGVIEMPAAIDASNVMLVCGSCQQPTRIAYKTHEDGRKARHCKKCGAEIETKR